MLAALVLAGIIAAPVGTIALLIKGSGRVRDTGAWPRDQPVAVVGHDDSGTDEPGAVTLAELIRAVAAGSGALAGHQLLDVPEPVRAGLPLGHCSGGAGHGPGTACLSAAGRDSGACMAGQAPWTRGNQREPVMGQIAVEAVTGCLAGCAGACGREKCRPA